MKRSLLVVLSVLVATLAPTSAFAWWEHIEKLSGPGPFKGWSFEARLVCFVDPTGTRASVEARFPSPLEAITASCKLDDPEVRRAAFDLHMRFVWSDNDARFANGQRIGLTTLAPSMSWNVIPKNSMDILDVGIAGGVFWFSSREFPSFSGAFIEPLRLDFHAPSNLKGHLWSVLIPRVRFALIGFPGGFEPDVFAPSPAAATRIPRDWVKNIGIFVDLDPLLRRLGP